LFATGGNYAVFPGNSRDRTPILTIRVKVHRYLFASENRGSLTVLNEASAVLLSVLSEAEGCLGHTDGSYGGYATLRGYPGALWKFAPRAKSGRAQYP
jgi:hypothetical protein